MDVVLIRHPAVALGTGVCYGASDVPLAAGAAAARRGILVKGGVYLEQGRRLAWLALDKTGTITRG
ncbi:hypothetical protein, partial [Burkholderia pseudomallei]|uniref:hypothetical protein n=1 Tax=Burkholderia pseudomallei TaxID=28450 RepID=UPI0015607846